MKRTRLQLIFALCLIALVVGLRVLPHPANFAPVAAVAIFGGAVLPRKLAIIVPLVAMMISDWIIGSYNIIFVVWGCYLAIGLASSFFLRKRTFLRGAAMTFSASTFFFVVTNFAVWLWSGMYEHTLAGLIWCYEMGLPFFRGTALSDMFYTAAMFSALALANYVVRRKASVKMLLNR